MEPFSKKLKSSFVREAKDIVDEIEVNLESLEKKEARSTVFNRVRVLNGSVYCVGLKHLGLVGTAYERLVDELVRGLRPLTDDFKTLLKDINDWYKNSLVALENDLGAELETSSILEKLNMSGDFRKSVNARSKTTEAISVLIIEDDVEVAEVLENMLKSHNFKVTVENNAHEIDFESMFVGGETKFDVIVTDLMMPQMPGVEVVRAVRCFDSQVPILVMSGHGQVEDMTKLINFGIQGFLHKPVPFDDFLEKIFVLAIRSKVYRSIQNIGESSLILNMSIDKVMPTLEEFEKENKEAINLSELSKGLERLRSMLQKIQTYH